MGWIPWFSGIVFAALGWSAGRATNQWYAASREATRRQMNLRSIRTLGLMIGFWALAWQGFVRFGSFDLESGWVVGTMMLPLAGLGYILAVRQYGVTLFGRRLPRRLRPRLFARLFARR